MLYIISTLTIKYPKTNIYMWTDSRNTFRLEARPTSNDRMWRWNSGATRACQKAMGQVLEASKKNPRVGSEIHRHSFIR